MPEMDCTDNAGSAEKISKQSIVKTASFRRKRRLTCADNY